MDDDSESEDDEDDIEECESDISDEFLDEYDDSTDADSGSNYEPSIKNKKGKEAVEETPTSQNYAGLSCSLSELQDAVTCEMECGKGLHTSGEDRKGIIPSSARMIFMFNVIVQSWNDVKQTIDTKHTNNLQNYFVKLLDYATALVDPLNSLNSGNPTAVLRHLGH